MKDSINNALQDMLAEELFAQMGMKVSVVEAWKITNIEDNDTMVIERLSGESKLEFMKRMYTEVNAAIAEGTKEVSQLN